MECSLQTMCIETATSLFLLGHWPKYTTDYNPFVFLPSAIVNRLFKTITNCEKTVSIDTIYPLIISDRLSEVEITHDMFVDVRKFIQFLHAVSDHANQLKKLCLQNKFPFNDDYAYLQSTQAIENLLLLSRNLKTLEISMPFDLSCLQNIPGLEHLLLGFEPNNRLVDMVPHVNGAYQTNTTMHYFGVRIPFLEIKIPAEELAVILQHWSELKHVGNDIAGSLEVCHGSQLVRGWLSERYKLERIKLGCYNSSSASVSAINIATITCPNVKELDVYLVAKKAVAAISNFKNLEIFAITWNSRFNIGNFQLGLNFVIEKVGASLSHLKIDNFGWVDLAHIGRFCPNLRRLDIMYESATTSGDMPCFEHLESLHLECNKQPDVTRKHILLQLLCQCRSISYLCLNNVSCFDDDFVREMLSLKYCPKLYRAVFCNCGISRAMETLLKQILPSSKIILSPRPLLSLPLLNINVT